MAFTRPYWGTSYCRQLASGEWNNRFLGWHPYLGMTRVSILNFAGLFCNWLSYPMKSCIFNARILYSTQKLIQALPWIMWSPRSRHFLRKNSSFFLSKFERDNHKGHKRAPIPCDLPEQSVWLKWKYWKEFAQATILNELWVAMRLLPRESFFFIIMNSFPCPPMSDQQQLETRNTILNTFTILLFIEELHNLSWNYPG